MILRSIINKISYSLLWGKGYEVVGITYTSGQILQDTYQIIEEIGQGGAGVVYLAYHLRLEKYVVIKKIKEGVVGRLDTRTEVDMLKSLHHKYLPQVYDFFQEKSDVYTVLDYIEGSDLASYVHSGYRIPEDLIIKWLLQLTEVLEYLHTNNPPIIHSDIKPSNIIITPDMDVCLIDFNISMSDGSATTSGITPSFSSPEQIAQSMGYPVPVDSRTDIYSLGATFFQVMTLNTPFLSKDTPLDYSPMYEYYRTSLIDIIKIALNQRPENRYQTAREMHREIEKTTDEYRVRWIRNLLLSVAAVLVILGATAGIVIHMNSKKETLLKEYSSSYNSVVNEYNSDSYDTTELREEIQSSILNNSEYAKVLDEKNDQNAELHYIIGYTYYLDGDYTNALKFYKEAAKLDKKNVKVYRELSVCSSRAERYTDAEVYLEKAKSYGADETEIDLMQAELYLAEGKYQESIDCCTEIVASTFSEDIIIRSAIVCSEASGDISTYSDFIDKYKSVSVSGSNKVKLDRLLLNACIYEGDYQTVEDEAHSYYMQAMVYGTSVINSDSVSVDDELSMAKIYVYLEMYDEAKELLQGSAYIESDYRIYMWMACLEYKKSGLVTLNSAAQTYYNKAIEMDSYQAAVNKGNVDPIMNQLGEL